MYAKQIEARGRAAERARIAAILRLGTAQGALERAIELALDTDVEPEEAAAALAEKPSGAGASPYAETIRRMMAAPQPSFGNTAATGKPGACWDDVYAATAKQMGLA